MESDKPTIESVVTPSLIGFIFWGSALYLSAMVRKNKCNTHTLTWCLNILTTIGMIFILLPLLFKNNKMLFFIMTILIFIGIIFCIITFVLVFNTNCIPDLWMTLLNMLPGLLLILTIFIMSNFNVQKFSGIVLILVGIYFLVINVMFILSKNNDNISSSFPYKVWCFMLIFISVCIIVFGYKRLGKQKYIKYIKVKTG